MIVAAVDYLNAVPADQASAGIDIKHALSSLSDSKPGGGVSNDYITSLAMTSSPNSSPSAGENSTSATTTSTTELMGLSDMKSRPQPSVRASLQT